MADILPITATFVPGPSDGLLSENDLATINRTTSKPFRPEDLYGFACVMATNALTSYATRLGTSSLMNMAADAESGAPYHLMHDRQPAPYGYTFRGAYDPTKNEALAGVYIPRGRMPAGKDGRTSNQEIADIASGMRREVSIGFYGPMMEFRCDLCGNDVFSLDCPHLPGMKFDGQLATATVENARLLELSGVDRGACPGAIIGKARQMAASHTLSAKEFAGWCDKAHVPSELRTYSVPADAGKGTTMALRAALVAALSASSLVSLAASITNIEDDPEKLAQALAAQTRSEIDGQVAAKLAADPLAQALKTAEITDPAKLSETLSAADFGRAAALKLRADAKSEGIRALGQEQAATIEQALAALPIGAVEALKDTWTATANAKFGTDNGKPAARQTAPAALPNQQAVSAPADGAGEKDWKTRRQELLGHDPIGKEILKREEVRR